MNIIQILIIMPKSHAKALYNIFTYTSLKNFASASLLFLISCNKKDFMINEKNSFITEVKTDALKGWMNSKISNSMGYEKEFIDSLNRIIEWGDKRKSSFKYKRNSLFAIEKFSCWSHVFL
jgi:hypothetical protein